MNREEIDQIAWATIHARKPIPIEKAAGLRAMDYRALDEKLRAGVDFEHTWSDFLHAFYDFKTASFFVYPSLPSSVPGGRHCWPGPPNG